MAERPHIVLLSYAPDPGGVTTYQALQLAFLASKARVTFVDERPGTTLERVPSAARQAIEVITAPVWSAPRTANRALAAGWDTARPDLIALSNPALLITARSLLRRLRKRDTRVMQTLHSGTLTMTLRRRVAEAGAALLLRQVDDLVFVSGHTREYWSRYPWLGGRGRVVLNGIGLDGLSHEPRVLQSPVRIAFAGRLEAEKGIARFLEVARLARAGSRDWIFDVYGDGSGRSAVQAAGDPVRWHGHVDGGDAIFRTADLLLITSPIENAPFVALEAKRAGVPTVSARVGGLPELIEDGVDGIFSASLQPADMLDALDRAVAGYPELAAGVLRRRDRFTLDRQLHDTWQPVLGTL